MYIDHNDWMEISIDFIPVKMQYYQASEKHCWLRSRLLKRASSPICRPTCQYPHSPRVLLAMEQCWTFLIINDFKEYSIIDSDYFKTFYFAFLFNP